ncbi:MAG: hypothetical protein AVO33_03960 [delta proteobacterium ML8_F1]|nr:MAG: hypothetical protein AVO33_03960 [delta proteobacterium ML8_F1]
MTKIKRIFKEKRRMIVSGTIVAAVLAGALIFLGASSNARTEQSPQLFTIARENIEQTFETTGTINAREEATVVAPFASDSLELEVTIGQTVEAGELLASLDTAAIEEKILASEISLLNYESQRKQLFSQSNLSYVNSMAVSKANYQDALEEYEANTSLYEKGSISKVALEQSRDKMEQAYNEYTLNQKKYEGYDVSSEIMILDKNIEMEFKRLEELKEDFAGAQVRAPIKGTVTSLDGEDLEAIGDKAALMTITNLEALEVEAAVSEYEVQGIREGQPAVVYALANPSERYEGVVTQIYPVGDTTGGEVTVTIIVSLDNTDENIKPGFSAGLEILLAQARDALVVPYDAIVITPQGENVMKMDAQGEETLVEVTTGIESSLMVEVISESLHEGDQVVVYSTMDFAQERTGGLPIMGGGRSNPGNAQPPID